MTSPVLVESPSPGVSLVSLNCPDRRNAMTAELTEAFGASVAALAADRSVRAVVVTGRGSAFCAGGDLSWIEAGSGSDVSPDSVRDRMLPFYRTWLSVRDLPVPVVAAVNGSAIGAGLCLALACDVRYAAAEARFSAPFTKLGMHPGMAASWLLPEVVGMARARELLYTGRALHAEEALSWGLVSGIAADVVAHAVQAAEAIAGGAPVAVRLTKAGLAHPYRSMEEALQWESLAQPVTMATSDLREGLAAAAERRRPHFTGR
ncbi:MAG: enoyl-CoA hydratase/isomerase family protein [Mycobacteriales bacterium]